MAKDVTTSTIQNTITVNGQGIVRVEPDTALVRLGVVTDGENLQNAQMENNANSQQLLDFLRDQKIIDLSTYQYNIEQRYDYVDGTRVERGYTIRNIYQFRTREIMDLGRIIDLSTQYGANVVDFITFQISDEDYYYLEALNMAVDQAYQKAKSVSRNLGLVGDPVPLEIIESGSSVSPLPELALRDMFAGVPIEAGTKEIISNVSVEYLLPNFIYRNGYNR